MVNKVHLLGRLGADPEIRNSKDGDPIANLRLATSERWKNRDGEKQERTDWHNIVIFGGLAKIAEQYLVKGSQIYIEGKLQTRKWQDKDGNDKYTTEVVVDQFKGSMEMLGGGNGQGGSDDRDGRDDDYDDDRGGGRSNSRRDDDDRQARGRGSRDDDRNGRISAPRSDDRRRDDRDGRSGGRGRDARDEADPKGKRIREGIRRRNPVLSEFMDLV